MTEQDRITSIVPKDQDVLDIDQLNDLSHVLWNLIQDIPDEEKRVEASSLLVSIFEKTQQLDTQSDDLLQRINIIAEIAKDMRLQRDIALDALDAERKRRHENERKRIMTDISIMNNIAPTQSKRFLDALTGDTEIPLDDWTREDLIAFIERIDREVFEDEMYHADADALAKIDFNEVE